jgi:hypothetical protein
VVITAERARQLAGLTYETAVDWSKHGWMSPAEWHGYKAAYDRGVDGWRPKPDVWRDLPPEVESIAGAIAGAIGVRKGRLFDERSLDDPPEWTHYVAGSVTKGEAIALRTHLLRASRARLRAVDGDPADDLVRELDELFDDLLHERADWLRPTPAAFEQAARAIGLDATVEAAARGGEVDGSAARSLGELAGDTPYEAAVGALEAFGDAAVRHEDAALVLEAQLTLHGFDRDTALMTHVRALHEAAVQTTTEATAALAAFRSRHGLGREYHASDLDADASGFRQAG